MLSAKQKTILLVLTFISLSLFLLSASLETGYEHPIQTTDSKGNPLGFNDPITWELYGILFRSASFNGVLHHLGFYGGIYLLLHLAALAFFCTNPQIKPRRLVATVFFLQPFIFPLGLIGILALPFLISDFFTSKIDCEAIQDFPPTFIFQSLWLWISILAGIFIWRSAKGVQTESTALETRTTSAN
jgi:hypothetical protein